MPFSPPLENQILPVRPPNDALPSEREALPLVLGLGQHGYELAGTEPAGLAIDGEVDRDGLVAVSETGPLIPECQISSAAGSRCG